MFFSSKRTSPLTRAADNAIFDSTTGIILALTRSLPALHFLRNADPEATFATGMRSPHYATDYPLDGLPPIAYVEWQWLPRPRKLARTDSAYVTNEIRSRSALAQARLRSYTRIVHFLNVARSSVDCGVSMQESVYTTKRAQAQSFRASGYDESQPADFPYVLQYADYARISMKEAADRILLKAKLDEHTLAKTELLRLKYFDRVRAAKAPQDLKKVDEEFMLEYFTNAMV
jgi:hypothetical protein